MEFCMLLRMLLGCGLRLGEPLAARVKDVNFHNGTILICHAKNDKQRVVPMDRTLTEMLERYCIAMGIFAIHSFARAEKNGRPTDDSVPFLSVYLGHHDMDETEKYLKFSGDMFPEYTKLFEDYATGVFTEMAYEEK